MCILRLGKIPLSHLSHLMLLRSRSSLLSRFITTQSHSRPTVNVVNKSNRPMSPHMTIYQPQLTWLMSIGHRVTGAGLASAIYGFGLVSSANFYPGSLTLKLCELVAEMPVEIVLAGKFVLTAPFMFHLFNGMRHLVWDSGRALSLRGVYTSGWIVNIATLISSLGITFL